MALRSALTTTYRVGKFPFQWRAGLNLFRALTAVIVLTALGAGYLYTGQAVTLRINGQPHQIRGRYPTVDILVQELDLTLKAKDIIQPALGNALKAGDVVTIQVARPVTIEADGTLHQLRTQQQSIGSVLTEAGITINPGDEILVEGKLTSVQTPLPPIRLISVETDAHPLVAATTPGGILASSRPEMIGLSINRAVSVTVLDDQVRRIFHTTRPTVAQLLAEQDILLLENDRVTPNLASRLSTEMEIRIDRATPVSIAVNGQAIKIRTQAETVSQVLGEAGIVLMGQDFSRPPADHLISTHDIIEVIRVHEAIEISQKPIRFDTQWIPDEALQLDQQEVRQAGGSGLIKTRTRIHFENGQEVWRQAEDEWLDHEPSNRVIAYGTKVVVRTLETEAGPVKYWRRIPMLTTAYSAATSGKSPDHPNYGITRTGKKAGRGIVAVDPRVIPLLTNVYVPEYGKAIAGDTGGGVLGKHIDLGYSDEEGAPLMYEWRDIYILTPVPSFDKIRYVLPQWPQQ